MAGQTFPKETEMSHRSEFLEKQREQLKKMDEKQQKAKDGDKASDVSSDASKKEK